MFFYVVKNLAPEYISRLPSYISGILIEEGGEFSHGAILARERKIPCVVGIKNLSKIVRSGDRVAVDAKNRVLVRE